ncbi:DUF736 family protein [Novosphingobium sp.]|uniref:DUF736 family protein n=1 Tax=Novosphingobium sp. TaxID=1874826 RepID=UPI0031CF9540
MNIGEMIRSENGGVNGYIAEAGFDFDGIFLEKVASDNPRAPLFNLMTKSPRGRDVRLGSIWERAAKETGETYFGGYIDTAQSGFVPIRMFRSRQQDNVWNIVRPTAQRRREGEAADLPAEDFRRDAVERDAIEPDHDRDDFGPRRASRSAKSKAEAPELA